MTAKQYLKQIKLIEGRIYRNRNRISELRAAADGLRAIRYDGDPVQTSPEDRMAEVVGRIVDLETETAAEILRLEQLKTEVTEQIHTIGYEDGENVLYMKWVAGLSFYAIADQMHYSLRHVHRIHGRALQLLTERCHTMSQSDMLH